MFKVHSRNTRNTMFKVNNKDTRATPSWRSVTFSKVAGVVPQKVASV